jgi:hypothetical protein
MRRHLIASASTALCLLLSQSAFAQAPEGTPTRLRGTVERVERDGVIVRTRTGQEVAAHLAPTASISGVVRKSLTDIREGDFVASTSVRDPDGKLRAIEVHFLPAGANEGQFPYDLAPNSLMTNASVAGISSAADGRLLRVTYKGTEASIFVPPDAPVVAFTPADRTLLRAGAAIVASAVRQPNGQVVITRATLEKDGVKPPM